MNPLILLMIILNAQIIKSQWLDPHDMNPKNKEKVKIGESEELNIQNQCNCESKSISTEEATFKYLKRITSLLLQSTTVDKNNFRIRNGKFVLNIEDDSYKFLTKFSTYERIDDQMLRQLDGVLNTIFQKRVTDDMLDFILTSQEMILNLLFDTKFLVYFAMVLTIYLSYRLVKAQFKLYSIVMYFIMNILIIDYHSRYRVMLEEAEEQNMKIITKTCEEVGWLTYLFSSKTNCEKKVVSPLEVALFQLRHMIVFSLSSIGEGMGELAKELWRNLPFPWNILIFPLMLIFIVILVGVVMTTMNESPFKLNMLHLFNVEFGGRQRNSYHIRNDTLDEFLDTVNHRPMIQTTRGTSDKKIVTSAKNKSCSAKQKNVFSNNSMKVKKKVNSDTVTNKTNTKNKFKSNNVTNEKCSTISNCFEIQSCKNQHIDSIMNKHMNTTNNDIQ